MSIQSRCFANIFHKSVFFSRLPQLCAASLLSRNQTQVTCESRQNLSTIKVEFRLDPKYEGKRDIDVKDGTLTEAFGSMYWYTAFSSNTVKVNVSGKGDFNAIIDTGAHANLIDKRIIDHLEIPVVHDSSDIKGGDYKLVKSDGKCYLDILINDRLYKNHPFLVLPEDRKVGMLLGLPFLNTFEKFQIEFGGEKEPLIVPHAGSSKPIRSGNFFTDKRRDISLFLNQLRRPDLYPNYFKSSLPTVSGLVGKKLVNNIAVDSGTACNIMDTKTAKYLNLPMQVEEDTLISSLNVEEKVTYYVECTLQIGKEVYKDIKFLIFGDGNNLVGIGSGMVLGTEFLEEHSHVVFKFGGYSPLISVSVANKVGFTKYVERTEQ